jgi:hypothetical protein
MQEFLYLHFDPEPLFEVDISKGYMHRVMQRDGKQLGWACKSGERVHFVLRLFSKCLLFVVVVVVVVAAAAAAAAVVVGGGWWVAVIGGISEAVGVVLLHPFFWSHC